MVESGEVRNQTDSLDTLSLCFQFAGLGMFTCR